MGRFFSPDLIHNSEKRPNQRVKIDTSKGTIKAWGSKVIERFDSENSPWSPPKNIRVIHFGDPKHFAIEDPASYDSNTVLHISSLVNPLTARGLGFWEAVSEATHRVLPVEKLQSRGVLPADKYRSLSQIIRSGEKTVCRHEAPAAVAVLRKYEYSTDATLVWIQPQKSDVSHLVAYVPSQDVYIEATNGHAYEGNDYRQKFPPTICDYKYPIFDKKGESQWFKFNPLLTSQARRIVS